MTPHTPKPAPIATTSVCKILTALVKKLIYHLIKAPFSQPVSAFVSPFPIIQAIVFFSIGPEALSSVFPSIPPLKKPFFSNGPAMLSFSESVYSFVFSGLTSNSRKDICVASSAISSAYKKVLSITVS